VNPSAGPRKQKLCKMSDEKVVATKVEVQRLLDVGFIHEVLYPSWLANVIMVRRKNAKGECAHISLTSISVVRRMIFHCRG
jgi:hypothetical protein